MGVERVVKVVIVPDWPTVAARLAADGMPAAVRMIDGLPAFPDEEPPAGWQELRLALAGGMVTVRRTTDGVKLVTWGTDDPALVAALDACGRAWADPGLHRPDG